MAIELPPLPWARDALAPHISAETIDYHYGKHHQAYVTNLNNQIKGTEFEELALEDIIRKSSGGMFNNAAQVWNHTFYWNCLSPNGGGEPGGRLADAIKAFGDFAAQGRVHHFGRHLRLGHWLVQRPDGGPPPPVLNAGTLLTGSDRALLTCESGHRTSTIAKASEHIYLNPENWESKRCSPD